MSKAPKAEHVETIRDPVTGHIKNTVRCPDCRKVVAGRGYGAHWRIMHDPDGGSTFMSAASGRRKYKKPIPDAAPARPDRGPADPGSTPSPRPAPHSEPGPEPDPDSEQWGW